MGVNPELVRRLSSGKRNTASQLLETADGTNAMELHRKQGDRIMVAGAPAAAPALHRANEVSLDVHYAKAAAAPTLDGVITPYEQPPLAPSRGLRPQFVTARHKGQTFSQHTTVSPHQGDCAGGHTAKHCHLDEISGEFHYKGFEKFGEPLDVPGLDVTLLGTKSAPDVPFDTTQTVEVGGYPQNSQYCEWRTGKPFAFVYPRVGGVPDESSPPIAIICKGTHEGPFGYNGATVGQSGGAGYQNGVQNCVLVGTSGMDEDEDGIPEQWFVVVPFVWVRRNLGLPTEHTIENPMKIPEPPKLEELNTHLADAAWFLPNEEPHLDGMVKADLTGLG